ncbi:MAG: hypothetical protein ACRDYC_04840 [Acidimicrobiales bacterium]
MINDPQSVQTPRSRPFAGHSLLTLAGAALAVILVLTVGFWLLGLVFSVIGWIIRLAILAAVGAVVWHFVARRLRGGPRYY